MMQREMRSRSRSRLEEGGDKYQENADSRLKAFRQQYPVDERAFDFLQKSPPEVQDRVLTDFRPQSQGQDDYSALLTIFVKKVRGRWERGSRGSDKFHRRHASREAAAEHAVAGRRGRSRTRHGGPRDLESDSDGPCSVVEAARAHGRAAPLEDVVDSLCASDGCSHSLAGGSARSSSSSSSSGSSSTDNDEGDNKAKDAAHQIELLKDAALQDEHRRVSRAKAEARRAAEQSISAGMAEAEREMQEKLHEYTAMLQDEKQQRIDHVTALAEQAANEQIRQVEDDARLERMEKFEAAEAMAEEAARAKLEKEERARNDKRLQKELRRMKNNASKHETDQKEKRESKRKAEKYREGKRKQREKARLGAGRARGSRERRRMRKLKRRHGRDRGDRGDRGRVRGSERAGGERTREGNAQRRCRGRESRGRDSRDRGRDDSRGSRDGSFRQRGERGSRGDHGRTRRREARGGPRDAEFEAFRERYPMDARAFATLTSAPPEVQNVVLSRFKPRSEGDDDYSALVMTFVRAIINRRDSGGTGGGRKVYRDAREGRDHQEEQFQERAPPRRGRGGSDAHDEAQGGGNGEQDCCSQDRDASPVTNFRLRYPMDDRAFASLQQAPQQVQDVVLSDFKPRREGDDDYSALVMSFVRAVQTRVGAGRPPTTKGSSARPDSQRE